MENLDIRKLKIYDKRQKFCISSNRLNYVNENCLDQLERVGNENAEVLLVVSHNIADLNSPENVLLIKILEAVGLTMEKVFIVRKPNINLNILWRYLSNSKCLFFGINPLKMGLYINVDAYVPTVFDNKVLLLSHSINALQKHPEKKKLLWKALQNIFK